MRRPSQNPAPKMRFNFSSGDAPKYISIADNQYGLMDAGR